MIRGKAEDFLLKEIYSIEKKEFVSDNYYYNFKIREYIIFQYMLKSKKLYVDYFTIWFVLKNKYYMKDLEIKNIIIELVAKILNINVGTALSVPNKIYLP